MKSHLWGQSLQTGRPSSRHLFLFRDDPSDSCVLVLWNAHNSGIHYHRVCTAWGGNEILEHELGYSRWFGGLWSLGGLSDKSLTSLSSFVSGSSCSNKPSWSSLGKGELALGRGTC